jgi:hypothetical protein
MDETIKAWWLTLSPHRLHNHLTLKLKLPAPMVAEITAQVNAIKESRRASKIKNSVVFKSWADIIDTARREVQTIRTLKHHIKKSTTPDPQRWDALCNYETVVAGIVEKLHGVQKDGTYTPTAFVRYLQTEGKRVPLHQGKHWTDYVKPADRDRIEEMFAALPHRTRGKTKEPFERTIPKHINVKHRIAMFKHLDDEIINAQQALDMARDDRDKEAIRKNIMDMEKAKFKLDQMPRNQPVPAKWQDIE